MHYAADGGQVDVVRYLALKMESLLHKTDRDEYNMLHHAAQRGHADVVQLAVEEYNLDFTARDVVSVY